MSDEQAQGVSEPGKVEPCPFGCRSPGGYASDGKNGTVNIYYDVETVQIAKVMCLHCGASRPSIEAWNRRAPCPKCAELERQLAQYHDAGVVLSSPAQIAVDAAHDMEKRKHERRMLDYLERARDTIRERTAQLTTARDALEQIAALPRDDTSPEVFYGDTRKIIINALIALNSTRPGYQRAVKGEK